jgi:tetratricopeptide (TPR) repeat protein
MALANVAAHLASIGRRVVIVDFDLEAPGLDSFEEFDVSPGTEGLVEYVCHYLENGRPADVQDYVREVQPKKKDEGKSRDEHLDGKLWLMTSGAKNEGYNKKRLSINWTELYEGHSGVQFFENFKADIEDSFKPDYVLIDSRTGLTDVGGVCTLHLPDLVVLLFALNEQNLQGIASVARVLRDSEKFPQLIPVATPVPNLQREKESLLEERYQRAKELLGAEVSLSLSYSPGVALKEKILVWDGRTQLRFQYEELAEKLMQADPAGIDFLRREAESALEGFEIDRAKDIGNLLEADYGDRADAWLTIADIAKATGGSSEFERSLRRALDLSPGNVRTFARLEALLRGQKRFEELLALVDQLIQAKPSIKADASATLHRVAGEILMKVARPSEALIHYEESLKAEEADEDDNHLVALYNVAEARRRSTQSIVIAEWNKVVLTFEKALAGVSSLPLPMRANQLQAMHVAYACLGNVERAKSLLDETTKLASQASRQERLFSVAHYDNLPLSDFIAYNRQMREALDRDELWDGMKLKINDKPE